MHGQNVAAGDHDLGSLLRRHRVTAGLSQEELAERAGISTRAVSDIERGMRRSVYRDTVARLVSALGLAEDDRAAFEAAARGRAAVPSSAGEAGRGTGLPARLDRLIGRERDLETVTAALRSADVRLLTLTGAGGIGKTRLAAEVAAVCATELPDGAVWVSLAATREPGLVLAEVARVLGVAAQHGSLLDGVITQLRGRRALLVLDNFEHVLDAAPQIVEVLAVCPGVTVLATSRAPLGVAGEHQVAVPPLPAPQAGAAGVQAAAYPSVELFVDRARAARHDLVVDGSNMAVVADICARLDGVPLALELAARRVRHLTLEALRDQLAHRLDVLAGGRRDVEARHQTMRATVAWSYELLQPAEQELLRRLSVFAGGWTLDAAAAVCGAGIASGVLQSISALVDHSLVFLDGERYRMLEVIRELAAEEADVHDDVGALRDRHAAFFLALAEQAMPHLVGAAQQQWYARLDAEHDNLRIALRHALTRRDADTALRLAGALWMFWRQHGDFVEGSRWLEECLALPGDSPQARLPVLWGAAWLAYQRGDHAAMGAIAEEHLALARSTGDRAALRNALTEQGMVLLVQGRYAEALVPFGEALDVAREVGTPWIRALSLFNLGDTVVHAGDVGGGEPMLAQALAEFRTLGDDRFTGRALGRLATAALLRGDRAGARELVLESLRLFQRLDEKWGVAEGLEIMSAVASDDAVRAARLAGAAQALREQTGTEPLPVDRDWVERFLAEARERAGAQAWDAATDEGMQMSPEEAAAFAAQ